MLRLRLKALSSTSFNATLPLVLHQHLHFSSETRQSPVHPNHPIRRAVSEALEKHPFPDHEEGVDLDTLKSHIKEAVSLNAGETAHDKYKSNITSGEANIYLHRGKHKDKYMPVSPWVDEPRVYKKKIDALGRSYGCDF